MVAQTLSAAVMAEANGALWAGSKEAFLPYSAMDLEGVM